MALDLKNLLGKEALTYLLQKIKLMKTELQGEIAQKSDFSGNYNDLTNKPEKLPNPEAITFTGGATGTYDGSSTLTVNIPAPTGLAAATENVLGGIQAAAKGDGDTVQAKIGSDNKLYVPGYPTELPASDVYEWAKQENKPTYTPTEVGVIGTAPTSGQVAVFDGTTGKIKSIGFTIASSVPANAKFTDTTYTDATSSASGLMPAADKEKLDEFQAASNYALKSDLTTVYKYKGTVENDEALPVSPATGDVYNITNSALYGDGANVAWTGTAWDNLAGTVDLSGYVETADMAEIGNSEIDSIWNTVFAS